MSFLRGFVIFYFQTLALDLITTLTYVLMDNFFFIRILEFLPFEKLYYYLLSKMMKRAGEEHILFQLQTLP